MGWLIGSIAKAGFAAGTKGTIANAALTAGGVGLAGAAAKRALSPNAIPTTGPTPPPVTTNSAELKQSQRSARNNLRRTQSVFAGERKQTLG